MAAYLLLAVYPRYYGGHYGQAGWGPYSSKSVGDGDHKRLAKWVGRRLGGVGAGQWG